MKRELNLKEFHKKNKNEKYKAEIIVNEIYNGVLDFYVDYGFVSSIYADWFWKIFYEKGSKGNKFSI